MVAIMPVTLCHEVVKDTEFTVDEGNNHFTTLAAQKIHINNPTKETIVLCALISRLGEENDGCLGVHPFSHAPIGKIRKNSNWQLKRNSGQYNFLTAPRMLVMDDECEEDNLQPSDFEEQETKPKTLRLENNRRREDDETTSDYAAPG